MSRMSELHRQNAESEERIRDAAPEMLQALRDIVNPLGALQRFADEQGAQLNGTAYSVANSTSFAQEIARKAIAKAEGRS